MNSENKKFKMWSLFPFITRDVAVWVPEGVLSSEVLKIIKENELKCVFCYSKIDVINMLLVVKNET